MVHARTWYRTIPGPQESSRSDPKHLLMLTHTLYIDEMVTVLLMEQLVELIVLQRRVRVLTLTHLAKSASHLHPSGTMKLV